MSRLFVMLLSLLSLSVFAAPGSGRDPFAQLGELLPTANTYRTASGAPGQDYWQQRADYKINAHLDAPGRPSPIPITDPILCTTSGCNWIKIDSEQIPSTDAVEPSSKIA